MNITEVRIKLIEDAAERLLAFCSITLDAAFVVRDMKIIVGPNGPFVAMPSRKLTSHCQGCGCKNPIRANFCNQCGGKVIENHMPRDEEGRPRLYADIAHPINARCREMIQSRIVEEYEAELVRAKEPGYVSRYDDPDEDHRSHRNGRGEQPRSREAARSPDPHNHIGGGDIGGGDMGPHGSGGGSGGDGFGAGIL